MNSSEKGFYDMCVSRNWSVEKASKNQDMHEHWDFKVRDSLIDIRTKDIDIATKYKPEKIIEILSSNSIKSSSLKPFAMQVLLSCAT